MVVRKKFSVILMQIISTERFKNSRPGVILSD